MKPLRPIELVRDPESGCLECVSHAGRGRKGDRAQVLTGAGRSYIYRWVWEVERGEIPLGMEIDHLCENPFCCEVTHLEVVTRLVNGRRGQGLNDDGTCPAHPGSRRGSGRRACRDCQRLAERWSIPAGFLLASVREATRALIASAAGHKAGRQRAASSASRSPIASERPPDDDVTLHLGGARSPEPAP